MDFKVNWIGYETGLPKGVSDNYGNPSPYFRKKFILKDKKIEKATVLCSALGLLKVYINGKPIADDYLTPGWTDYRKRVPVMETEVKDLLRLENAVGIIAGDGWAVGNVGTEMLRCNYFPRVAVAFKLTVTYSDGEQFVLSTDETWKASSGEIVYNDLYNGEYVDKRLNKDGFSEFDYDDSFWNCAEIYFDWKFYRFTDVMRAPVTTVKEVLNGKLLYIDKKGKSIYDFSQNATGVIRAHIKGDCGAKIVFRYGEMLDKNGSVYTANLRKAIATDTFVCSGTGVEVFRPLFTFHGFRYMEAEIIGKAEIVDVKFEVMYSDIRETGHISCSDNNVNKLFSNIMWSQKSNFINVPTDCPQRDERLGWLGDAQIFVLSAMYNMDCKAFYEKFVCDILDSQLGNGAVCGIAPHVPHLFSGKVENMRCSAGWQEAIVIIPFTHYLMYGDKKILYDSISAIKRFMEYLIGSSHDFLFSEKDQFGDWLNIHAETDLAVIAIMYAAYAVSLTEKICRVIKDDAANDFSALFVQIRDKFRAVYLDKDYRIKSDTQAAYLMAFAFGLVSKEEVRPHILRKFAESDGHLSTGFLGVKHVLPVLCDIGEKDLAYRVLTDTTYPSWCYSVVNGATTVWERWNGFTLENGINDGNSDGISHHVVGMNSFNHYSLGSCAEWFYMYMLGITQPAGSYGFKKVLFKPFIDFSGKISYAKGHYISRYGKISVEWKVCGNKAVYSVSVPEKIGANFDFSDYSAAKKIADGVFELTK